MTEATKPNAHSPYQRYAKAPTLYSQSYQRWAAAIRSGNHNAAAEADAEWRRMHGRRRPHQRVEWFQEAA